MPATNDLPVRTPASATPAPSGLTRPLSPDKLAANRANARRSTGPKSEEGKRASRLNALRHELTAAALMPHEDPAEFAEFADQMRADLRPRGPLQELLAGRAITLAWKLLRAPAAEAEFWARRSAPSTNDEGGSPRRGVDYDYAVTGQVDLEGYGWIWVDGAGLAGAEFTRGLARTCEIRKAAPAADRGGYPRKTSVARRAARLPVERRFAPL